MTPRSRPLVRAPKCTGVTLLEVLVALLVLSFGLLGLALMQTAGLRFATDSYSRSQATFFAYDIIERMRLNPTGFAAADYDIADHSAATAAISAYNSCKSSACDCDSTACDSGALAKYDLGQWYDLQKRLLTGAELAAAQDKRATIVRNGNRATITLWWMEQDEPKSQAWEIDLGL